MDGVDPKLRAKAIAIGVLVTALALVDLVVLRGESVGGGTIDLRSGGTPLVLHVTRPGEEHLVEIRTRKRVRDEEQGRSIAYRLVDPDGVALVEESELISRKKRFFSFRPAQGGSYTLHAEESLVLGTGGGSAQVSVTVGDRRTISRWLGF